MLPSSMVCCVILPLVELDVWERLINCAGVGEVERLIDVWDMLDCCVTLPVGDVGGLPLVKLACTAARLCNCELLRCCCCRAAVCSIRCCCCAAYICCRYWAAELGGRCSACWITCTACLSEPLYTEICGCCRREDEVVIVVVVVLLAVVDTEDVPALGSVSIAGPQAWTLADHTKGWR